MSFFFIKKREGGLRPCIDYRALNLITVKNRYPLPLVPSALEQLQGAQVFTKLDLRRAYNLIRIREGDEWKTAFITLSGHYGYCVMPFGLANAPSVFQGFLDNVLREYLNRFVIVYINDILVYSRNEAEHIQHVSQVLRKLREHHLYAKSEKCEFHQDRMKFLGYYISPAGISMDEGKVSTISAPTEDSEGTATLLGIRELLQTVHQGLQSDHGSAHHPSSGEAEVLTMEPRGGRSLRPAEERLRNCPHSHTAGL